MHICYFISKKNLKIVMCLNLLVYEILFFYQNKKKNLKLLIIELFLKK